MSSTPQTGSEDDASRLLGGYRLLQTLVAIRLRTVTDPASRRHLTWLSDIVAALSLLNRRMAADGPVDFAGYLDDASAFWRRTCEGRGIRLSVRGSVHALPDSHAMPLAIMLHELLSNAVRHAFPGEARGSIAVAFSQASDGVSLVVRDTGIGATALPNGEGLALVEGLVQHLGGSMAIETAAGAGVGVRLRLPMTDSRLH